MRTKSNLQYIHKKIDEIQIGLLRFQQEEKKINLHVRAKCNADNSIDCVMSEGEDFTVADGRVTLVQKSDENYLYISGDVATTVENKKEFSFRIVRACWFILKSKGAVSWLQEKYIYNLAAGEELELAS